MRREVRGLIGNATNPEAWVKPSQYFRAAPPLYSALDSGVRGCPRTLEVFREAHRDPVAFAHIAICIATLFLYCTALWIDS
jgi:hypothetical protein